MVMHKITLIKKTIILFICHFDLIEHKQMTCEGNFFTYLGNIAAEFVILKSVQYVLKINYKMGHSVQKLH